MRIETGDAGINKKETRWHQRFENFEKSCLLLTQSIEIESPSVVERAGYRLKMLFSMNSLSMGTHG